LTVHFQDMHANVKTLRALVLIIFKRVVTVGHWPNIGGSSNLN